MPGPSSSVRTSHRTEAPLRSLMASSTNSTGASSYTPIIGLGLGDHSDWFSLGIGPRWRCNWLISSRVVSTKSSTISRRPTIGQAFKYPSIRAPHGGGVGAGSFHSQSVEGWFTSIPGLKVVAPATPHDAKGLLLSASPTQIRSCFGI